MLSGSETPVVVVLSASMEPAIQRGDILFLWQNKQIPYSVGEIIVYKIKGMQIPIIHRITEVRNRKLLIDPVSTDLKNTANVGVTSIFSMFSSPFDMLSSSSSYTDSFLYNSGTKPVTFKDNSGLPEDPVKLWIEEDEVLGRATGFLPSIGLVTLYLTDYPMLKFWLITILGLLVLTTSDS
jgi:signal peptidase